MVLKVEIRRPKIEDLKELNLFFRTGITDTFTKEGLGERLNDINDEIGVKEKYLESDFECNGDKRYFLFALDSFLNRISLIDESGAG